MSNYKLNLNNSKMMNFRKVLSYTLFFMLVAMMFSSCAKSKDFVIDGKEVTVEPYGWFDLDAKHDSVVYKINVDNIILDVIFFETIVVPIILTGDQLYEPVRKK